mgnify:CR=1 FL=1
MTDSMMTGHEKVGIGVRNSDSTTPSIDRVDPTISSILRREARRQALSIELIASENFVSEAVLEALGTVLTNKYAEGYPGRRYYGGCHVVDEVEELAIERARELFGADHANVQPHSGSQANAAVYQAVLTPGDRVLAMNLAHGGESRCAGTDDDDIYVALHEVFLS